jgi:ribosomal protein S18 acetylase RimI-like enzyme
MEDIHAAVSLPDELQSRGISMRAETADDAEFLASLYLSVRWQELAVTNWPDEAKRGFLAGQFHIQTQQYRARDYDGIERWIVESRAGAIGRLYLLHREMELRVVDISLLPEWRNHGIGTSLLRQLGREADGMGIPLRLHVEQHNPALRLYRRLGFQERETTGLYWLLERKARPQTDFSA